MEFPKPLKALTASVELVAAWSDPLKTKEPPRKAALGFWLASLLCAFDVRRASEGGFLTTLGAIVRVFDFRGALTSADLADRDFAFAARAFVRGILVEEGCRLLLVAGFIEDLAVLACDRDLATFFAAIFRLFRSRDPCPRCRRPVRTCPHAGECERGHKRRE